MGVVIAFPGRRVAAPRPSFGEWMNLRFPNGYAVVKRRNYSRSVFGLPLWKKGQVLLLPREHDAYMQEYERTYGKAYP